MLKYHRHQTLKNTFDLSKPESDRYKTPTWNMLLSIVYSLSSVIAEQFSSNFLCSDGVHL